jgi:hypothetical protein
LDVSIVLYTKWSLDTFKLRKISDILLRPEGVVKVGSIPKDRNLFLSTSQLGSSTSRAFVRHNLFGDCAGHVVSGAAEQ